MTVMSGDKIWAKPIGRMPRTVVHCRTLQDVQFAIAAARPAGLSLSVRAGGHDWAGRGLCDGIVIDLSGMREVVISRDRRSARILGGARASDVLAVTDPLGLVARDRFVRCGRDGRSYLRRWLWPCDWTFRARRSTI